MVARLKLTRQRTHWTEMTRNRGTDKTDFHEYLNGGFDFARANQNRLRLVSERRGLLMSNTEHLDSLIKGDSALVWYTFGGRTHLIEIRCARRTGLGQKEDADNQGYKCC